MVVESTIAIAIVSVVIFATLMVIRHREQTRAAAREAEKLNVISNDTRGGFWNSAADTSDSGYSGGGDDGGDD